MGVLTNGAPYLSLNGISKLCGIESLTLRNLANNWITEKQKDRGNKINIILQENNYNENVLYIKVAVGETQHINAFPDIVCMALLEYYAFEANKKEALKNYRTLARQTLRQFIYTNVGYNPQTELEKSWKYYHDRVFLVQSNVPTGQILVYLMKLRA